MEKKKCYYAHTMLSYGSTIEEQDIKTLETLGFEVVNPNQDWVQKECNAYAEKHGSNNVMAYFKQLIDSCEVIAFRSNPDGNILSGVSYELQHAKEKKIPIIELPCSLDSRMWDYPKTKQYLIEVGHYKIE